MNGNARLCHKQRSTTGPISTSCPRCFLFDPCGGLRNDQPLFNCFDQFCCDDKKCDNVCPYKPDDYR